MMCVCNESNMSQGALIPSLSQNRSSVVFERGVSRGANEKLAHILVAAPELNPLCRDVLNQLDHKIFWGETTPSCCGHSFRNRY